MHMAAEMEAEDMPLRLEMALERAVLLGEVLEVHCSVNDVYSRAECCIGMDIPLQTVQWILGNQSGYESAHTTTVSGLASMTVFRKLCEAENTREEEETYVE